MDKNSLIDIKRILKTDKETAPKLMTQSELDHNEIFKKLEQYMNLQKAWRDPDLSMSKLVRFLGTNRTTFAKIIKDNGYESYTNYINKYRVEDFIETIETEEFENLQDVFFDVGFRSRATALRNFKQFTGMTPSEYIKAKRIAD